MILVRACLSHHFYPALLCFLLQPPSHSHCTVDPLSELLLFHRAAELRGVQHPCPLVEGNLFEGMIRNNLLMWFYRPSISVTHSFTAPWG